MAAEMKFVLGADVSEALKAMTAVDQRTLILQKQIEFLQQKIGNTTSIKQFNTAMDALARKQSELNKITAQTANSLQNKFAPGSNQATQSLINLSRVAQDAPYGFIGIANNINPLLESFQRLKGETGTTGGAFKALGAALSGPAGIGLAVGVASSLLVKFGDSLFGASESTKKLADEQKKIADQQKEIVAGIGRENAQIDILVGQLKKENLSRSQKEAILKQLSQANPQYFGDLKNEAGLIENLNVAYDKYLKSLVRRTEAALLTKDLEQISTTILELERKGAVRTSLLPKGVGFDENRKITNESLKQLSLSRELEDSLKQRDALLKRILEKSDIPVDEIKAPKIKKVKQDKPLDLVFQPIIPKLDKELRNPVLEALKRDQKDILTESEQIGKLINDSIAKNIKPLPKVVSPEVQKQLDEQQKALQSQLAFAQQAASQISDAFSQAFDDILAGENVFKAVGEAVKGLVLDIAKAAIRALIFRAILNAIVPGGAKALDLGGVANLLPGRANGGPVSGKSPYIIGERGPELFVPSVSGNVIPNNRLSSFSGRPAFASGLGGGRTIVRGNDILLASARTQRSQNRVNA
jgi:hypothetical protein